MKIVDACERTFRKDVFDAFSAWAMAKADWRNDDRNKNDMFSRLHRELTYLGGAVSATGRASLAEIKRSRDESIKDIFTGAQLVLGKPQKLLKSLSISSYDVYALDRAVRIEPVEPPGTG